jgi:hypothetical protein
MVAKPEERDYVFYFNNENTSFMSHLVPKNIRKKFIFGKFISYKKLYPINNNQSFKLCNLSSKTARRIKKLKKTIVLDSSTEGFSHIHSVPSLDQIYSIIDLYDFNPSNVVLVSMNLFSEETVKEYAVQHGFDPIRVISKPFMIGNFVRSGQKALDVYKELKQTKKKIVANKSSEKFALNLNNFRREYRSDFAFYLGTSKISQRILQSHKQEWYTDFSVVDFPDRTQEQKEEWAQKTPILLDKGIETNPKFYKETFFEIVNETTVRDWHGTSKEYSEKTARPFSKFQPFVIYGQPGSNAYLEKLGFRTYEDWFDLGFDSIEDPVERMMSLYDAVRDTVDRLDRMTHKQRVEWRFKNESVLIHNYEKLFSLSEEIRKHTSKFFYELANLS